MLYVKDIIEICGGILLYGDINLPLHNISKDTRTIQEKDTYIGIKGEKYDGNIFYQEALDKGASICILDNIRKEDISLKYQNKTIVLVEDSIKALGELAKYKRSKYNIPVVAVTGSVGKTSVKEMIANALSTQYKVLKTEANYNNHIGLPLTILKLTDEEIIVLEMGMNNLGEISYLTNIASPSVAVITNIGTAHIGNLGSRENILKAKLEIVENLSGPLIINNDNDMLHNAIKEINKMTEVITIGIENESTYMAEDIKDNIFYIENNKIESPIKSKAFIYNSLITYAVSKYYNIDPKNIAKAIKNTKQVSNRLEYKRTKDGITIIDDTYNSSLDAIKSSLEILSKERAKRKVAVLGDILEVGEYNKKIHEEMGQILLEYKPDIIITIGVNTYYTDKYLEKNNYLTKLHFNKEEDSHKEIKQLLKDGDIVLFKASHAMNLGNIVKYLLEE